MKRTIRLLLVAMGAVVAVGIALILPVAQAQVAQFINYQASLTDQNGELLPNGNYNLTFGIYTAPQGGSLLWVETHNGVSVVDGYFNVILGQTSGGLGSQFGAPDRYLGITVNGTAILPRQQVLTAPTALAAGRLSGRIHTNSSGLFEIDNASGVRTVRLNTEFDAGRLIFYSPTGVTKLDALVQGENGNIFLYGSGSARVFLSGSGSASGRDSAGTTRWSASASSGLVNVRNSAGTIRAEMDDAGVVNTRDSSGNVRAEMTGNGQFHSRDSAGVNRATVNSNGRILLRTSSSTVHTDLFLWGNGAGGTVVYGPNGTKNAEIAYRLVSEVDQNPDIGRICAYNQNGDIFAAGCIQGDGALKGAHLDLVTEHPSKSGSVIRYSAVSGPETAILVRGKVALDKGRATIHLPEHFAAQAAPGSLTVSLTPHSLESKGVAVGSIDGNRVEIGELQNGFGSYEVSYVIHGARQDRREHKAVYTDREYREQYMSVREEAPEQ